MPSTIVDVASTIVDGVEVAPKSAPHEVRGGILVARIVAHNMHNSPPETERVRKLRGT